MVLETKLLEVLVHRVAAIGIRIEQLLVDRVCGHQLEGSNLHERIKDESRILRHYNVKKGQYDHDLLGMDHLPEILQ